MPFLFLPVPHQKAPSPCIVHASNGSERKDVKRQRRSAERNPRCKQGFGDSPSGRMATPVELFATLHLCSAISQHRSVLTRFFESPLNRRDAPDAEKTGPTQSSAPIASLRFLSAHDLPAASPRRALALNFDWIAPARAYWRFVGSLLSRGACIGTMNRGARPGSAGILAGGLQLGKPAGKDAGAPRFMQRVRFAGYGPRAFLPTASPIGSPRSCSRGWRGRGPRGRRPCRGRARCG